MKNIVILILIAEVIFAEWANSDITSVKSNLDNIDDSTALTNYYLSLSLYNPLNFKPSAISPEYQDNLNISRGHGQNWFESWELTDNNARLYAIDEINLRNAVMRSAYGRYWDDSQGGGHIVTHFQDMYTDPYISSIGSSNVVGEQIGAIGVTQYTNSDVVIKEKADFKATYLVNSFQSIAQDYLNYTYTGQPLFEIDLTTIGLFYERIKESLPGYVVPSVNMNPLQDKKITVTLVPTQGTVLYTVHQSVVRYRDLITYCMWGFLVFETFNMIIAYANK